MTLERKHGNNETVFSPDVLWRSGRVWKSLPALVKCGTVSCCCVELPFNAGGFCGHQLPEAKYRTDAL